MRKTAFLALFATGAAFAQTIMIPDGTKVRVRLDQTITSATAEQGQTVELSVTENVQINDQVVIPEGSRVTGTITDAHEKRRMGRAGKLDFSVERVRGADGEWIPLRYTVSKKTGQSDATRNGIITAGVAVVFWPAAPLVLLAKGKDVTINKGVTFDVFTDSDHLMKHKSSAPASQVASVLTPGAPTVQNASMSMSQPVDPAAAANPASITINSPTPGAEIEVNGAFVGSTPTTLKLAAGAHTISVRSGARTWQRVLQITPGSTVTVTANFPNSARTFSN